MTLLNTLTRWLSRNPRPRTRPSQRRRPLAGPEILESRLVPASTAFFNAGTHVLTVLGTAGNDNCVLSRSPTGAILLDGQTTGATMSNTDTINISTGAGVDQVTLDQTNGLFGPGFTPEAGRSNASEIEITVHLGNNRQDGLTIKGRNINDTIVLGRANRMPAINLNGDSDFDVTITSSAEYRIDSQGGDDRIDASAFPVGVTLVGGDGDDWLKGANKATPFNGLEGGRGNDTLLGGPSPDRYVFVGGNLGSDTIIESNECGDNWLLFGDGHLPTFAGPVRVNLALTTPQVVNPGNLTLKLNTSRAVSHVIGSDFNDIIVGNACANSLSGGRGNDVLTGVGGADQLYGNAGHDALFGGYGRDSLYGGTGNDRLYGDKDRDALFGEAGDDYLNGGSSNGPSDGAIDQLTGGPGADGLVRAPLDVFDFNSTHPDHWVPVWQIEEQNPIVGSLKKLVALSNRVEDILREGTNTAEVGAYLKRVDGAILASVQEDQQFEPASMIKVLIHLHAMRQVQAGQASLTDQITYYFDPDHPDSGGVCPDNFPHTTANGRIVTLEEALRLMMQHSDNRTTHALQQHFGTAAINATAVNAGLTSTVLGSPKPLGCGAPGNYFTLEDAGRLYERVANGSLLTAANQAKFYELMGNGLPGALPDVIKEEAAQKLGKSVNDPAVQLLANQFIGQMRQVAKDGGYRLVHSDTDWREIRTNGGRMALPFKSAGVVVRHEYVYGAFIENAIAPMSNPDPVVAKVVTAMSKAQAELFREEVRAALATW